MNITLIEINNYTNYVQFYFCVLSISINEIERSIFCLWKDGNKFIINLFFLEFKIGYYE